MAIPDDVFQQWISVIEQRIRHGITEGRTSDAAIAYVEAQERADWSHHPETLAARLNALERAQARYLEKLNRVSYLQKSAIRFGRQAWYAGPAADAVNWNELARKLLEELGRSEAEVASADEESTTVLSLVDNPGLEKFSTRGLVVGHIQSGKTGNMAAVIAKAADTPFKFFLILAGMTDTLRNQTQARLDRDVVGAVPERWYRWTECDAELETGIVKGDFKHPAADGFAFDTRNQLAVIKKNAGVLRRFLAKLKNTDQATLRATPFLIIDDECDQASVNSAALQTAVTRINGYIREILGLLPRAAYIGYSATPFANVLIDPRIDPAKPEDLYPRTFIHALRRPEAYFGTERLFGRAALDGEHNDTESEGPRDGLDMIREIPNGEIGALRPTTGVPFTFEVTPSLDEAVRYFVLVTAARAVRGQADQHSTMLVHTSVLNSAHRSAAAAIGRFVETIRRQIENGDAELIRRMATQWELEQERVLAEQFDRTRIPFSELRTHLAAVANSIEVKVENWSSTNRIDYSTPGRRYLVIGGNVLARGLTLEGLSVSFFLRSSSQYDTLMQMGRWFGYRPGYEDLPRVWMEASVQQHFFDLAAIEAEIRRDINRYAAEEITPQEFAVRIRRIPGMAITAPAKMRSAQTVQIGYAGSHLQTTRFFRADETWLQENWAAGAELVAAGKATTRGRNHVITDVPAANIGAFWRRFRTHPSHRPLAAQFLLDYLARENGTGRLLSWNVVVVGAEGTEPSGYDLGRLGRVPTVRRSALKGGGDEACVKALMSRRDLLADIDTDVGILEDSWESYKDIRESRAQPPLLLLYPIEKESKPKQGTDTRVALNAVRDVLGMGVVFPGLHAATQVYVSAAITPDDAVETPEGEDSLPADVVDVAPPPS
jgi:hypothetical protein